MKMRKLYIFYIAVNLNGKTSLEIGFFKYSLETSVTVSKRHETILKSADIEIKILRNKFVMVERYEININ